MNQIILFCLLFVPEFEPVVVKKIYTLNGIKYFATEKEIIRIEYPDGKLELCNNGYVCFSKDQFGNQIWYVNGKIHREDGPAIIREDGTLEWYQNNTLHREDGPAIEYPNGRKEWWLNGKRYQETGPIIQRENKEWYYQDYSEKWYV